MSNDKRMIGDRLKILLEENGMDISKGSLMDKYGFNKSNIHKYLNNIRRPNLDDIIKLADIFNTSVDYLVGYNDYALDTFDPDYLEEFIKYASGEIKRHFNDRQGINIPDSDPTYTILFGLTHHLTSEGKSFEDLSPEEKEYQQKLIDYIISIYYGVIRMNEQSNFNIDEFKGILDGIFNFIDGGYSFKNASIIDNLEKREDKTEAEKIEILKSYIQFNMANNQRALNLLEELNEKK